MTVTAAKPQLRWSSVRDCPRKAIFESTGAPAREETDRERRIKFRGKTLGRDVATMVAAGLGGEQFIERERKVPWPLGMGHVDVYVIETRTAIEVLSSAHASAGMVHSKLLQVVGYCLFDPAIDNVEVRVVNPADYELLQHIVRTPESPEWADLVAEVDERVAQVVEWQTSGGLRLPSRVCQKPTDSWGHFCRNAEHCFDGWEKPPLPVLDTPDVVELAAALHRVGELRKDLAGNKPDRVSVDVALEHSVDEAVKVACRDRKAGQAEHLEKQIKQRLTAALGQAPDDFGSDPGEYAVGPLVLKRTRVETSGYTVAPGSYEKLSVKRLGTEPLLSAGYVPPTEFDYGEEVPF